MNSEAPINGLYTIGHSTHPLAKFINLLLTHNIPCLCDVRSAPYSRWQPQYNREPLASALRLHEIDYLYLGAELGARSDDRSCYEYGKVVYRRLASTEEEIIDQAYSRQENRIAYVDDSI